MLVSEPQHTQHVISSVWETCRYIQVQPCIKFIKDNNEFWHLVNSDRAQISQDFMVNIFFKKISGLQKLLDVFSRNCRTHKFILDRTNFVPWARIAIVFAEFAHNCITTAIFNCSCSMNFYNGFWGSTIWPPKNKLHLENSSGFQPGSYSTLAWPLPHVQCSPKPV